MKKTIAIILVSLLVFSGLVVSAKTERELRTLEGSYKIDVSISNSDNANLQLKHSYGIDRSLTPDLIDHSFVVDIKYVDGQMLLFNRGEEIKNSGMSSNNEQFNFNFVYEVPNSAIPGIGYQITAVVKFNDSLKSFDDISATRLTLYYIHQRDGETRYGSIGNGTFTITKVGNEVEDEPVDHTLQMQDAKPMALTFVKGLVQVKRAGTDQLVRARRNMPINPGDTVYTGRDSYADVGSNMGEFAISGHDFTLMPMSSFVVPHEKVEVPRKSKVRVIAEDMIDNVKKLFSDDFEIETPSAVMGIRGTDFIIDVDYDGNTTVLLIEGSVEVKSKYDDSSVMLEPGQKVVSMLNNPIGQIEELNMYERSLFDEIDYDTLPDYYSDLGEDEVIEDIEAYNMQRDSEIDNELIIDEDPTVGEIAQGEVENDEGDGLGLFLGIVAAVILVIIMLIRKLIMIIFKKK
jgi:hypothetical protein